MTFARKVLLAIQEPGACMFLVDKEGQAILGMINDQKRVKAPPTPPDDEIVEIHPCTEEGMVTLWAQLKPLCGKNGLSGDFFDQYQLCESVSHADIFDKNECSPKMGYAYVELKGKRTHIFKTGKIIMRRADNREDALATLSMISKLLLPARICSCGNLMADCFGGCCDDCFESTCKAFMDEEENEITAEVDNKTTVGDILKQHSVKTGGGLKANYARLDDLLMEIKKVSESQDPEQRSEKTINDIGFEIKQSCSKDFLDNRTPEDSIIALMQYGLVRDMLRAGEGLLGLKKDGIGNPDRALKIFFDAYSAFMERDLTACSAIWTEYENYISEWKNEKQCAEMAKIATNGFYISRILGKPVHDKNMFGMDENHM
jgi:hypothetical protein